MKDFILNYLLQNEFEDGNDLGGNAGGSSETDSQTTEDDSGSGLAPEAGEENQSKNNDGEDDNSINQEKVNAAINKQHFLRKEQERRAEAAEKKAAELQAKLDELAAGGEIVIPELPDPFDENYAQKVKERDDAIKRKAEQDALKKEQTEQQNANKEAEALAKVEAFNEKANAYATRGVNLGVDGVELKKAGDIVGQYITDPDVAEYILDHAEGPLITKYLAANPLELDELASMNPVQAAIKINSDIATAAALLKPKASNAPEPPDDIEGRGGVGEKVSPFIAGATFE